MPRSVYNFFRRHIGDNWGLKLFSLVLAGLLWLALAGEPVSEIAVKVPIALVGMPAAVEISTENIPEAQVRLRGPERIIRHLQASDVFAEIELTGVKPGERTFEVNVHRPRNLTVVQVIPSTVHLAFDLHAMRSLPVQPRVIGASAAGYAIARIEVDPSSVEVKGPKQKVEALEAATTDAIDLTGAMDQRTFVRQAYVSDPLVQVTSPDPVRITVTVEKISSDGH